jgi:hypothetical protein
MNDADETHSSGDPDTFEASESPQMTVMRARGMVSHPEHHDTARQLLSSVERRLDSLNAKNRQTVVDAIAEVRMMLNDTEVIPPRE